MAFVIGFFIDNCKDLESEEKVVVKNDTVIPEHPSCSHVSMEQCKLSNPKFCPECGIRLGIIPQQTLPGISKIVYKNTICEDENIRIFRPESYVEEGYICTHYGGDCYNCLQEYYENPLKGYNLKEEFTLVYADYNYCILYDVELKEQTTGVILDDDLLAFRLRVLDFCSRHNIKGEFEIRYIHF